MENENIAAKKPVSKTRKRMLGVLFILIGLVLGYFFIYLKIADMEQQKEITYSVKAMVLVPFSMVFGLYYILFTPSGSGAWKDLTVKERPIFIITLVLAAASTFFTVYVFSRQLSLYGYNPIF